MKTSFALLLALAALTAVARPQEAVPEEPGLIPELPTPVPKPNSTATRPEPGQPKSSTEKASDDLLARIRFRTVKTKALQSEAVQDEWIRAHQVKTDRERRAGLQNYYRLLYDRMVKLDPTLKKSVDVARKLSGARVEARKGRGKGRGGAGRHAAADDDDSENN